MCDKKVDIFEKDALVAYNAADEKGKKMLVNLLGSRSVIFIQKITDRVSCFNDILDLAGTTKSEFDRKHSNLTSCKYALEQIELFVKVLNEGWTPDWANENEYKWYPCLRWNKSKSGFGFAHADYGFGYANAFVGSRLVFKSRELAEFAGKFFEAIYNEYMK